MGKIILFFFFIFILSSLAYATLNLSMGSLYFNMKPGEISCEKIKLLSSDYNGRIEIKDVWASSMDNNDRNLNRYNLTAMDHNLMITHINSIESLNGDEEIEICIFSNNAGNYRGAIIFTPEAEGNIIVAVAAWLNVNIGEENVVNNQNQGDSGSSAGSSVKNIADNLEVEENKIVELEKQSEKITTKAVQDIKEESDIKNENLEIVPKERNYLLWGIITFLGLFIFSILIIRTINIRKRRNKNGF